MQNFLKRGAKLSLYGVLAALAFVVSFFTSGQSGGITQKDPTVPAPLAHADAPPPPGDGSGDGGSCGGEGEGEGEGEGGDGSSSGG